MSSSKICNYHSHRNCFLYTNSKLKELTLDENAIFEVLYQGKKQTGFFSLQFSDNQDESQVFLNGIYAKQLNIDQGCQIYIKSVPQNNVIATSITIRPITDDDLEILELNLDYIQLNLLDQIKVVFKEQIFPIWIESDICIFVKTVDFEPNIGNFTCINSMTKILIDSTSQKSITSEYDLKDQTKSEKKIILNEWSGYFQVEFNDIPNLNYCNNFSRCPRLTTLELRNHAADQPTTDFNMLQYLVSIEALKSPMQTLKPKDSNTPSMRKFLKSIENSYQDDYYFNSNDENVKSGNTIAYALLNISSKTLINLNENEESFKNAKIQMSTFLRHHLSLFELNPKVLIKAESVLTANSKYLLSTNSKRSIKLATNYKKNFDNVKLGFIKFIDQNSDCLCPIILSNNMIIKVSYDNDDILCKVFVEKNFLAVNSFLILHDLLKIEIESIDEADCSSLRKIDLEKLNSKKFKLEIMNSRWFNSNVEKLMNHLETNLFSLSERMSTFRRNIVLQGMKGSGKSTLCKFLCNKITQLPYKALYHYINCQNLMSKTADTIYDQLKLVYKECIWYANSPSLVILENLDLLIENKSHTVDPSSMLYHSQIVESVKDILNYVWSCNGQVVTIVTISCPFSEMPSLFHCLDEHGLFTEFVSIKTFIEKEDIKEIIDLILEKRNVKFEASLIEAIVNQTDGFVFKDIEKLIDKIILANWNDTNIEVANKFISLSSSHQIIYNYVCINMSETKFYKSKSQIGWSLVGGLEVVKKTLVQNLIWPIKYKKLYKQLLMKQSAGVLLYGPSGCGKTLIASVLANESKFNFISVKGPELLSKYIGNSEQNVRELFNRAEKAKPCIIFFDEFDSLAPRRGHDSTGVTDRVVNQLLTQLDGVEQLDGVFLLGATSRPDLIDQALLRPGRLDSFLYVGFPDDNEIKQILSIYLNQISLDNDVDLDIISKMCSNFSGADIKSVACDSLVNAFHRAHKSLTPGNGDMNDELIDFKLRNQNDQHVLKSLIKVKQSDLITSIESIRKTININERESIKRMYQNWGHHKIFSQEKGQKKQRATLA